MKRLMIAAMGSGSGKTVFTCGLLAALTRRGLAAEGFKCGPDYIDPMFHKRVLGVPSRNLDLFLQGVGGVRKTLAKQRGDVAIVEGAMGFYDGVSGTDEASAWDVARATGTPVVLVVQPKGQSITLAAQLKGMMEFRAPSMVAGVVFTNCKASLHAHLAPIVEAQCGLPVLGFMPPMEEAVVESRHLGLMTAGEVADFAERFDRIAAQLEESVDIDALLELAVEVKDAQAADDGVAAAAVDAPECCTVAVARDDAFCFYYEDNLDELKAAGARIAYFSPLHDAQLPEADALYIGGGYPELYARELSANASMRASVAAAIAAGMPTVAECGGFMYLQASVESADGEVCEMVGALPGRAFRTERLQRFGYNYLSASEDTLLVHKGERIAAHEFHYWDCTDNGHDLVATKPTGKSWDFGFASPQLYAGFPHVHFGGALPLAQRIVDAACSYRQQGRA